ncbi:putative gustatory receptor 22f [Episyrphus balteatus]|uniref:putative gustatory receptor 22f n=1 Tax=Episyrphus balteatus TaxID=286459 RepID=UPI002486A170|nr:putative gustatory receptor 22f [Episyrphus balteatus]
MILENKNPSLKHTVISIYFAVLENIIFLVENQFYYSLVFCNYMFELLNDHINTVTNKILSLKIKLYRRDVTEILIVRKGFNLQRELELIGKMHTQLFDLVHTARSLFQFQILTVIVTVFVTQVSLCFRIISYFRKNQLDLPMEFFYVEGSRICLSVGSFWLLCYISGSVVCQCNMGGELVKILTSKHHLGIAMENQIEILTFQFKREKLRLSLCGLFDLSWGTAFDMVSVSVMYLLLLLQLDYKNL